MRILRILGLAFFIIIFMNCTGEFNIFDFNMFKELDIVSVKTVEDFKDTNGTVDLDTLNDYLDELLDSDALIDELLNDPENLEAIEDALHSELLQDTGDPDDPIDIIPPPDPESAGSEEEEQELLAELETYQESSLNLADLVLASTGGDVIIDTTINTIADLGMSGGLSGFDAEVIISDVLLASFPDEMITIDDDGNPSLNTDTGTEEDFLDFIASIQEAADAYSAFSASLDPDGDGNIDEDDDGTPDTLLVDFNPLADGGTALFCLLIDTVVDSIEPSGDDSSADILFDLLTGNLDFDDITIDPDAIADVLDPEISPASNLIGLLPPSLLGMLGGSEA